MHLHRVTGKSDWSAVPARDRNGWQQVAAGTHGVVTIGNFFSLLGLASVPYGLYVILVLNQYRYGAFVLLAGRLCDLLDGWLADRTRTKSPLGEAIDAVFDKLSVAATVIGLAAAQVINWFMLVLLLMPHAAVAVLALGALLRDRRLHPSYAGKISMAAAWASLLLFTLLQHYRSTSEGLIIGATIAALAYAALCVSVLLGFYAVNGYISEFKRLGKK